MCSERDASTDRRTVDFGKAKRGAEIPHVQHHSAWISSDRWDSMVLVQALILKELQRRQLQKRGLRLAVYTLYTLAVPASGVACLLWFITIHHFIMLYGTIWHHNQILICQRDTGRSSCSFTACPSRFDGWSHWLNWLMACPNQLSVGCGALAFHPQTNAKGQGCAPWTMTYDYCRFGKSCGLPAWKNGKHIGMQPNELPNKKHGHEQGCSLACTAYLTYVYFTHVYHTYRHTCTA